MRKKLLILFISLTAFTLIFAGCDISGDDSGELALSIADRAVNEIKEVNVTLDRVEVHSVDNGWQEIQNFDDEDDGTKTFNLLDLRFEPELLGQEMLPTGNYTKIRLYLAANEYDEEEGNPLGTEGDSYIKFDDDTTEELFIPAGEQAGLQIDHNFIIQEGTITHLVLDNDIRDILNNKIPEGYILRRTAIEVIDLQDVGDIEGKVLNHEDDAITDYDVIVEAKENGDVIRDTIAITEDFYYEDENGDPDKLAGSYRLRGLPEDGSYTIWAYAEDEEGNIVAESEELTEVTVEADEVNEVETLEIDMSEVE